jgi:hypothetical protein
MCISASSFLLYINMVEKAQKVSQSKFFNIKLKKIRKKYLEVSKFFVHLHPKTLINPSERAEKSNKLKKNYEKDFDDFGCCFCSCFNECTE